MARKVKHQIDKKSVIDAFTEMAKEKKIDKDLLQGIIEETLSLVVKKKYGSNSDFEIVVNMDKGDIEIYLIKQVVEEVTDPETEISLTDANMYSADQLEVGDDFIEEITLDNIAESFGRRLILFASQVMNQKIHEVERDNVYQEYSAKVNEIIIGEIYQKRYNMMIIMHNGVEMKLMKRDQIYSDFAIFKKNKPIKAIIKEVKRNVGGKAEIYLSRTSNEFIKKLFELEIPEISDGIIQIKAIAREPGERMKIALSSIVDRVDPVGACVGLKGVRINSIIKELGNENIDLIHWVEAPEKMIEKALSPAKIKEINVSEETRTATVIVPEKQLAPAIGKEGQNVRLASILTGYDIKLAKEGGEDIQIQEFEAELGAELIQKLMEINVLTARDFLEINPKELIEKCEMDYDSIVDNRQVMLLEFDEAESEEYIAMLREMTEPKDEATYSETTYSETTDSETTDSEATDSEATDSEATYSETTDSETTDSETTDSETTDNRDKADNNIGTSINSSENLDENIGNTVTQVDANHSPEN